MSSITPGGNSWNMGMFVSSTLDDAELDPFTFRVYANLCRRANDELRTWPSVANICEVTGISDRKVRESLRLLQSRGMIEVVPHYREDGGQSSNTYRIVGIAPLHHKQTPLHHKQGGDAPQTAPPCTTRRPIEGNPGEGNPEEGIPPSPPRAPKANQPAADRSVGNRDGVRNSREGARNRRNDEEPAQRPTRAPKRATGGAGEATEGNLESGTPNPKSAALEFDFDAWFEGTFWPTFPNKTGKAKAKAGLHKIVRSVPKSGEVMVGLQRWLVSHQWAKEAGAYIPHASTWVNAKAWLDEPESNDDAEKRLKISRHRENQPVEETPQEQRVVTAPKTQIPFDPDWMPGLDEATSRQYMRRARTHLAAMKLATDIPAISKCARTFWCNDHPGVTPAWPIVEDAESECAEVLQ